MRVAARTLQLMGEWWPRPRAGADVPATSAFFIASSILAVISRTSAAVSKFTVGAAACPESSNLLAWRCVTAQQGTHNTSMWPTRRARQVRLPTHLDGAVTSGHEALELAEQVGLPRVPLLPVILRIKPAHRAGERAVAAVSARLKNSSRPSGHERASRQAWLHREGGASRGGRADRGGNAGAGTHSLRNFSSWTCSQSPWSSFVLLNSSYGQKAHRKLRHTRGSL